MRREMDSGPRSALLGLLMARPRHGYELYQDFSHELGHVWQIGLSQLYAQLKQLEEAGLVTVQTEPQPDRPPRKVYSLTAAGRAAFLDWLYRPTPYLRLIRIDFLIRLYFFHHLSLPGLDRLVAEQKAVCQTQIERFGQLAAEADDSFHRLVLEFRRGQLEAVLRWLDRCLEISQCRGEKE